MKSSYTLRITNAGPNSATGVELTAPLPPELEYANYATNNGSYDPTTGIWTVGAVQSGTNVTLTLRADVAASVPNLATITLTGTITAVEDQSDPAPGDESGSVDVTVASVDIAPTVTSNNATPGEGQEVRFAINVRNNGPSRATTIQVSAPIPAGMTYTDRSSSAYDPLSEILTVNGLSSGGNLTYYVYAVPDDGTSGDAIDSSAGFFVQLVFARMLNVWSMRDGKRVSVAIKTMARTTAWIVGLRAMPPRDTLPCGSHTATVKRPVRTTTI